VLQLETGWKLRDFVPGEGVGAGAHLTDHADQEWLPIAVPGDVHRTLIDAGRIADPFYADNETACAWMEQREWWYRLTFENLASSPHHRLTFHGLDTFATLYLNGIELGEHHNMFRPAVFDVDLDLGRNTLAIRFDPPLERIKGKTLSAWGRNPERTAMRKAQFGYGWDWGPRLPTIGVWRPVELTPLEAPALIAGVHFYTLELRDNSAAVGVHVELERLRDDASSHTAQIRLVSPTGEVAAQSDLQIGGSSATAYMTVDSPRLWWTHELGEPALYELSVTLDGQTDRQRVGIRTLTLDQSPDPAERGTRFFRFVLNGVPIFAKGADWIPAESFVGAVEPERYTRLLEQAREANMTMLRIWGGGIYEHDRFFDECDRLGILVWHDFMFACAMYPEDDPDFVAEVDAEARYQVRRLRSRACLALWVGNNENQWLHDRTYWDSPELPVYGALYYDSVLPRAVAELDGHTPYWPGTPYGGNDHNSRDEGNVHNWEVWHGNFPRRFGQEPRHENTPAAVSYRRYAEDTGRFISEFGMHAAPVAETLWSVIPPQDRYLHSPLLDWHNKDNPKNKGDNLLLATTGLPADVDQYILFSQIAQAEGLKFGIEHFRRRKPHCSGTLIWQLNDCWPVLSWSVLDYYGVPKAGYHFLQRVYAPLLASFKAVEGGAVELWLTNDLASAVSDQVTVQLGTFAGEVEWRRSLDVSIGAGASERVRLLDDVVSSPAHYLHVSSATGAFPANRHFFADIKDLQRQPLAPRMQVSLRDAHALEVELAAPADGYVYFAHLVSRHRTTYFSDNYVDIAPGETRTLLVTDSQHALDADALRLGWA
jgi:beta-mannosidase